MLLAVTVMQVGTWSDTGGLLLTQRQPSGLTHLTANATYTVTSIMVNHISLSCSNNNNNY